MTSPFPEARSLGPLDPAALSILATWFSPAFPIGAFAYSQGLEQAIADGAVRDRDTTRRWTEAVLTQGAGRSDLTVLARAYRAAAAADAAGLAEIADMALALAPSAERRLESAQLGGAFDRAVAAVWPTSATAALSAAAARSGGVAYPVAVGAHAAAMGLPRPAVALMFGHSIASTLISVAIRLVPIGQTDGLAALAVLGPTIADTAAQALSRADRMVDDDLLGALGGCGYGADIASMRHETLETRLFRT